MMNKIPTTVHGILDYVVAGTLIALPRALGWGERATRLLTGSALATVAYSLCTNYERGVVRALPMKGHLALDAVSGALLCAAPLLDLQERPEVTQAIVGLGLFELAVTFNSETVSPYEATA